MSASMERTERARNARERVLADHRLVAQLCDALVSLARDLARGPNEPSREEAVRAAATDLGAELERHLDYEERVVAPLLYTASPEGARRVDRMTEQHEAQRAVLAALVEDVTEDVRTPTELVDELAWFTRGLLREMDEEERELLVDDALGIGTALVDASA